MEAEGAIIAALNDVRAEFPTMRVRTEHIVLDGPLTVFRATIALPSGAEATGYGSVVGSGVDAIALAEGRALARAMALLGVDQDAYDAQSHVDDVHLDRDDLGGGDRYAGSTLHRAVADGPPADPFNLGPAPSAAAIASATGIRLGARPPSETDDAPADPNRNRPVNRSAARSTAEPSVTSPPEAVDAPDEPALEPEPENTPLAASDPVAARPATSDSDDDAAVSHQAFWRWAGLRGLSNRSDVEDLLGQSIGGMRPASVRDLIIAAQEGDENDA